jgi:hypothetical protein
MFLARIEEQLRHRLEDDVIDARRLSLALVVMISTILQDI